VYGVWILDHIRQCPSSGIEKCANIRLDHDRSP
jgi:hypothetical protein